MCPEADMTVRTGLKIPCFLVSMYVSGSHNGSMTLKKRNLLTGEYSCVRQPE